MRFSSAVGAGLQRRVEMRRHAARRTGEQLAESLVDLRRLDRREAEANARHLAHQPLHERPERACRARAPSAPMCTPVSTISP